MALHEDIDHTGLIGVGGSVATDAIWDAAGDLAVGSGANTAARLALGAAGGAVSRVNGAVAWNSATSFPTAATGDRIWRTDRGLEYYYDGTRWLTTTLYRESFSVGNNFNSFAASAAVGRMSPWHTTYDLWLVNLYTSYFVATTNDGTHNWTMTFAKADATNASTTIVTFTTNADAANTFLTRETAIGALFVPATYKHLRLDATKNNTPGNLTIAAALSYRLVG